MATNKSREDITIGDLKRLCDHSCADAVAITVKTRKGAVIETTILARADSAKRVLRAMQPKPSKKKKA